MPRDLPPLNSLRAFESAARHLNFTKASEELFVTQGAVSRQIKQLEQDLGQPLFHRDGPRIELTVAGENYRDSIIEGLAAIRRGTARIRRRSATLTVSVIPSFAALWLVPRIAEFHAEHPQIELRIASSYELVDFNRAPEIDAAIRLGSGEWPGVHIDCLFGSDVFPVCSPRLPEGNSPFRSRTEILDYPLIHAIEAIDDWERWFAAAEIEYPRERVTTRYNDQLAMQQAAVEGQGITLARSLLVEAELRSGRLIKPIDISIRSRASYYFVCPDGALQSDSVAAFHDWLMQAAGNGDAECVECAGSPVAA